MVLLMFFPDDLGNDNYAASGIECVMLASFVSISVHSTYVIAVVMCSRQSSKSVGCVSHLFGTETLSVLCWCCMSSNTAR